MKHLSTTPLPPSEKRHEVPHELDSIVLRALAKDPATATRRAEEMDADLARAARGQAVAPETEEAATQVLARRRRGDAPRPAPTEIDTPRQRRAAAAARLPAADRASTNTTSRSGARSFWPWLLALVLVAAAIVARLVRLHEDPGPAGPDEAGRRPAGRRATVETARGRRRSAAAGLQVQRHPPHRRQRVDDGRRRTRRSPTPGARTDKGQHGDDRRLDRAEPKVDVPAVVGEQATDAVAALTAARAEGGRPPASTRTSRRTPSPARIRSPGRGSPSARRCGSTSRRARSPSRYRRSSARRTSRPRASCRAPASRSHASTRIRISPRDVVIRMSPAANSLAGPGSTVTLYVSKGPTTVVRPGRNELRAVGRDRDAPELRLQGRGRRPGHGRRVPRRRRDDPDAGSGRGGEARLDRDDHGRSLHGPAARDDHRSDAADRHRPARHDGPDRRRLHDARPPARRRPDGRPVLRAPDLASRRRSR